MQQKKFTLFHERLEPNSWLYFEMMHSTPEQHKPCNCQPQSSFSAHDPCHCCPWPCPMLLGSIQWMQNGWLAIRDSVISSKNFVREKNSKFWKNSAKMLDVLQNWMHEMTPKYSFKITWFSTNLSDILTHNYHKKTREKVTMTSLTGYTISN